MTPDREAVRAALESLLAELTAAARREPVAGAAPSGAAPMEGAVGAVAAVDHPAWAEGPVVLAAGRTHLPGTRPEPPAPVSPATRMDLASVTKVVTALTALRLVEDGVLDLDAPVAETLDGSDPRITARHLLTHTAGFPPTLPLWEAPDREAGLARVRTAAPVTEPGTVHEYSCIGFMRLGLLLEALTARPLPELALTLVLEPTGAAGAHWIGTPRGATHDEAAWALGGVGNAGIHADMAALLAVGRGLADRSPGTRALPRLARAAAHRSAPGRGHHGPGVAAGARGAPRPGRRSTGPGRTGARAQRLLRRHRGGRAGLGGRVGATEQSGAPRPSMVHGRGHPAPARGARAQPLMLISSA